MRRIADQSIWPASLTHATLLARHKFERTMGTEVQDGICLKALAQVAIKSGKRMGWRKAFFKQQTHRVAFVTKGWLHTDENSAKIKPIDKNRLSVTLQTPWCRSPLSADFIDPGFAFDIVIDGYTRCNICMGSEARCITL